jgi:uncharacterized protein DUF4439
MSSPMSSPVIGAVSIFGSSESGQVAETNALQSALAAEHAAVHAYGVVGGVLGLSSSDSNTAYAVHRGRRDQLIAMIGRRAVAAEPAYELPFEVTGPPKARRLAARVEESCADVYADVVANTTGANRLYAARALTDCAVRALGWGAEPEVFPGLRKRG